MKIKLFSDTELLLLESRVNEFISSGIDVVDVSLSETPDAWTILILYRHQEESECQPL